MTTKKRKTTHDATMVASHPFGVRPSGNILGREKQVKLKRMGPYWGILPDTAIVSILDEVSSPKDLLALSHTCKALYAFASFDEFWKRMVYNDRAGVIEKWYGSWKESYWHHSMRPYINCTGAVYSDFLYRPFQCSQVDYSTMLANSEGNIAKIDEADMSVSLFDEKWHSMPFIINLKNPCATWTLQELIEKYGDVAFRQEYMTWPLKIYTDYMDNNMDESPLYLFDCKSTAMSQVKYSVPLAEIFGEKRDYFELLQSTRPDHRWLIIGPSNSGSTFHKDPNGTSAWNTVISGLKYWIMFPPGHPPPGVSTDAEESEVVSPISVAEWFLCGFYEQARHDKYFHDGWCGPGQAMYVPAGWWHLVINVTGPNVALTGNFVPKPKLPYVLNFLKNKSDQISGFSCDDEDDENCSSTSSIYSQFLAKLKETSPDVAKWALSELEILENKASAPSKWDLLTQAKTQSFSFGF